MKQDYKIIVEKKYYAVFTDGQGKEQKVEVSKEVADTIRSEQTKEAARRRDQERHTVSLDDMDYEGEFFASYDEYQLDAEMPEMTQEEKVRFVLKQMKPSQAEMLRLSFFENMTQEQIAELNHVKRTAITNRMKRAEENFEKIFKKLFQKP